MSKIIKIFFYCFAIKHCDYICLQLDYKILTLIVQIYFREENFCEEIETNLQGIIGYISSWSGFQNYRKQVGEKESEAVLKNFENEFKSLAEISDLSKPFKVKFNYFLLLGRKKN